MPFCLKTGQVNANGDSEIVRLAVVVKHIHFHFAKLGIGTGGMQQKTAQQDGYYKGPG
jgi:hypothetical protein